LKLFTSTLIGLWLAALGAAAAVRPASAAPSSPLSSDPLPNASPMGLPVEAGGMPRTIVVPVARGTTFDSVRHDLVSEGNRHYEALNLDPGIPTEGDGPARTIFTRDGTRVLLTNMLTDNVTVFDWATREVLANISVGDFPYGVAVTDEFAVVACPFSNTACVIRLSDYTVAAVIPTAERPWIVRASGDGRFAYVSTEIGDTCEQIDLTTLTKTLVIDHFPMELMSYTYNSENGRFWPNFLAFEVTPDGSHVFTGDWNDSLLFFDTTTGALDHALTGLPNIASVALSGDGTRAIALGVYPFQAHQIDLATFTRTDTVTPSGLGLGANYDMAVNQDGSKAFVGLGDNRSALIRFASHDVVTFSETLSPWWVAPSPDHAYAVSGQRYFSIVSFLTDSFVGRWIGSAQIFGTVSPVANHVAACDPNSDEVVLFYDFTTPASPLYLGQNASGEPPEGDAPRRVAITPDGAKAVVTDVLSANVTIFDLHTNTIEALVPVGYHPREVAITSDSRWAVVSSYSPGKLSILDLASDEVAATVLCGLGPAVVRIAPSDQTAYVADLALNKVFVVALAGPQSHLIAEIPVGEIGSVTLGGSVDSDIQVSPDGNELLVAVSFEDKVRVISTATHEVVAEIWVGAFPIQIAFDESGDYATVTNYLGNTATTMRIDGAFSSRIDTWGRGEGPLRIDSNPVLHEIGIGGLYSNAVYHVDPETGVLIHTDDYSSWGHVLQVLFDEAGAPIVLAIPDSGPPHLLRGADAIPLPAPASFFDYCPATQTAVVTCPGPDYVVVVHWDATGAPELVRAPARGAGSLQPPRPNPVTVAGSRLGFNLLDPGEVELALVDPSGRSVARLAHGRYAAGYHEVTIAGDGLAAGAYFAVLRLNGRAIARSKLTILNE